ncbi:uncharacterized protein EI90DRAFT_2948963 [Cantharellus anzutake]|uniref:uncharacterized protein n=1 Tax=Cantharellus anzutake TaxID=1750568 RepID=UPI001905D2E5|nr:uncharacterized protein EI90DRAFT_2948963 [Cantharellus anzutake]KAF8313902.1 hypothetical protein EI90DRAFT_2948963 [Cantharellus anzutake]
MQLTSGLLVIKAAIRETEEGARYMGVCYECLASLKRNKMPLFSLTNGLWVGDIPDEIADLTIPEQMLLALVYPHCFVFKMHPVNSRGIDPDSMQRGMVGNVTSYDMDTGEIIDMLEGRKMPRRTRILSSVIAVTYLGRGHLPKHWLKSTFRVRRRKVLLALQWLIANNPLYAGFEVDMDIVSSLPEDDVPLEILAAVRQEVDVSLLNRENDSYTANDESGGGLT